MIWSIAFAPLLPVSVLVAAGLSALAVLALMAFRRRPGVVLRALALALLLLGAARPELVAEDRKALPAVVALVADRSASQSLAGRPADTDTAYAALKERLSRLPGIEVREVPAAATDNADGTRLFADIARALSDVPVERIGGVAVVTDGRIHDVPKDIVGLGFSAPVHVLVTGDPGEYDRRVQLTSSPKFALVRSTQRLSFRLVDDGQSPDGSPVPVFVRRDGETIATVTMAPGEERSVDIAIPHAGDNIVEVEAPPLSGEISRLNNTEVAVIDGVRQALRVLLVSGEPHAGERTWRNLLKSDTSVDLVHFTILRPPEKQDGTPIDELSLIAFPTRELFDEKIDDFDLIIFDRYEKRGVLPLLYFDNIARYVQDGGALLMAAGPDPLNADSVYDSPLAPLLPAIPDGNVIETPFRPAITALGARHPVTASLPGGDVDPPRWSRWFRLVETRENRGDALMSGPDGKPLLILSREGKGRVAMLLSDQVWLWARGFEGGGPHAELLRNIAHWLMGEPELEEEALRLSGESGRLAVERRTLKETAAPVTVTFPDGSEQRIDTLSPEGPGRFGTTLAAPLPGLYKASDGTLTALTHVGPANPREFRALVSTTEPARPIAEATGGSAVRLRMESGGQLSMPAVALRRSAAGSYAGDGWIGFKASEAYEVAGVETVPVYLGLLAAALLLLAVGGLWWRESR
ncbi:MAG: hypothetical protein H6Q99_1754 [Proteobacteria bacterium]|nr:hypothetical protein [Pseudomonadota bacterium]